MPLSPAEIEALVNAAQALPLKDALALLVLNKVGGFATAGMGRLKKIIQDKQNEGKYAFVPNEEEARKLQQFSKEPNYQMVETLVPNYRYIDILRTGLLINFYHERNAAGDADRVKAIKMKICTRPNGTKLLKIANFPTTPFFTTVLRYVFELKGQGYPASYIEEAFDSIVTDWEGASKFVKNETTVDGIIDFCKTQAGKAAPTFFLLGMRQATVHVKQALEKLDENGFFEETGYQKKVTISEEGNHPRMEVIFIK